MPDRLLLLQFSIVVVTVVVAKADMKRRCYWSLLIVPIRFALKNNLMSSHFCTSAVVVGWEKYVGQVFLP